MSATDIITLEEAKRYLGNMAQSDTAFDTHIATYITGVSAALDGYCGPVVKRTVTDELLTAQGGVVFLQAPVLSVTTVTDYNGATGTVLTAEPLGTAAGQNNYMVDKEAGILWRRRSGYDYPFSAGRRNVKVTYVAGRFDTTDTVSEPYKLAACLSLADAWRSTLGGGNVSYGEYEGGDHRVTYAIPYQAQAYVERRAPRVA